MVRYLRIPLGCGILTIEVEGAARLSQASRVYAHIASSLASIQARSGPKQAIYGVVRSSNTSCQHSVRYNYAFNHALTL